VGADCGTISNGCGGTLNCGTCGADQVCTPADFGGICEHCGNQFEPCCAGNTCTAPYTCGGGGAPGRCGCGHIGEVCCQGATPCPEPFTSCQGGTCKQCGFPGEPCCPGTTPCATPVFGQNYTCQGGTCKLAG
jgi:hypothetical protein